MNINTNTAGLDNFSSPRSNSNSSAALSSQGTTLEERNVNVSSGVINLVDLFSQDYGNTGYQILKYLFLRDIISLKETCIEMRSGLFQKGICVTATELQSINQYVCPRLYARVQYSNSGIFPPVPVDAIVKNMIDLQKILEDSRFVVKGVFLTGGLNDLKDVCKSLPETIEAIEIAMEVPPNESIDLTQYQQLKIVRGRSSHSKLILPEGVTISLYDTEQPRKTTHSHLESETQSQISFKKEAFSEGYNPFSLNNEKKPKRIFDDNYKPIENLEEHKQELLPVTPLTVLSSIRNAKKNSNDISHSLTQGNAALEKRHVSISRDGTNLVNALFRWHYENIGNGILKYLSLKDIKALREVCVDIHMMLFQKDVFHLSITPNRLKRFDLAIYPRLYPRVQNTNSAVFQPVPADALVQNVDDLQTILKDARFIVKGIVFTGKLEDLKTVCNLLPLTLQAIEIEIEIPASESIDLSKCDQLKIVKVKSLQGKIALPKGVTVLRNDIKQREAFSEDYRSVHLRSEESEQQVTGSSNTFSKDYRIVTLLNAVEGPQAAKFSDPGDYGIVKVLSAISGKEPQQVDPFIGINQIPLEMLNIGSSIGKGTSAEVYHGKWNNRPVALKKIDFEYVKKHLNLTNEEISEALSWEIARLSTVMHPNIVQFYGISQSENKGYTYLIMEFCEEGDLEKKLQKDLNTSWSKRWQWALQITEALAYLHSQGVIHRDLKAANILLDHNDRAKLADLGLAQVDAFLEKAELKIIDRGIRDQRFIAPECTTDRTISNKATDIYALGLVFWQIISGGKEPRVWQGLSSDELKDLLNGTKIERELIPMDCPDGFKQLILSCWHIDPTKRSSAEDLISRLEALGAELNPQQHALIKACEYLEQLIYPKRKEILAYIAPFVTMEEVEESIENYWNKWESVQKKEALNPPLRLGNIFKNFIDAPGCSTLLLLGEAGLGKTLTTYVWADQLIQEWGAYLYLKESTKTPVPPYFPIFIRPTMPNWTHSALEGAFLNTLKQYGLQDTDIPLLLFIDGYDELQMNKKDPANLVKHLGLSEYNNAKLIVTCRSKTVDAAQLYECFNFNGNLQTSYFLPFSIDQLLEYLKKQLYWSEETKAEYKKTLEDSRSVLEALRNPFVLYLLKKSWKTLSQEPLGQLNCWKIYEGFVKHSIITQSFLLAPQLQNILAAGYSDVVDSFQAFARDVAFRACQNSRATFNWQEASSKLNYPWVNLKELVAQAAHKQFAKRQEELNKASEGEKAQKQRRALISEEDFILMMQYRQQQFEADLPLKIRGEEYEFSHRSLFEYFVAKRLLQICSNEDDFILKKDLKSLIDRLTESNPEALLLLHEGWQEAGGKKLTASSIIEASSKKTNSDKALANKVVLFHSISKVLNKRANYGESLEYCLKALAIREKVYSKDHPTVANSYSKIAPILLLQGKHAEAIEYDFKALAVYEQVYGKNHPMVANSYDKIGVTLSLQAKYEEAMGHYLQALAIYEKVHGKDHLDFAVPYTHIGSILKAQGKYEEAMEYYLQALAIYEKVHGKDHLDFAVPYVNIGLVLKAQGKYEEAMEYEFKALAIYEKHDKEHPNDDMSSLCIPYICEVLEAQGKYEEAMRYHLQALAIKERAYGKNHPWVANSYNDIGEILKTQDKKEEAMWYYLQALAIREKIYGKDYPTVANSYNKIGEVLETQGEYEEAMWYYLQALAIREKIYGKDYPTVANSYNKIGEVLETQGKYEEAIRYYLEALAIRERIYGKDHPRVANSYNKICLIIKEILKRQEGCEKIVRDNLDTFLDVAASCNNISVVLYAQGKYTEALDYDLKALAIREQVYGEEHLDVANSHNNIGLVLKDQGKYEEAMEHFLKALAIGKKTHSENHLFIAASYYNISLVLRCQEKFSEAKEYGLKALTICEQVYGKDDSFFAMFYNNIVSLLKEQEECEKATQYHLKTLATDEKMLDEDHRQDVAASYNSSGLALYTQSKHKEAMEHFLKALTIYEQVYGKEHSNVANSYNNIGLVLKDQGKHEEAMEHFLQALTIFEKTYSSEDHPSVAMSYNNISLVLKAQRKYAEAMDYNLKALAIYEKLYGREHSFVAMSHNNIDSILKEREEYEKTVQYHVKTLAVDEEVNEKEHLDTAVSYDNIGKALKVQGKYAEAIEYDFKALDIREKVYGKNHPSVAASYDNIGLVLCAQDKYAEALDYYLKALTIRKQVHDKEHSDLSTSYHNIGLVLKGQGKYEEAMQHFLKALAIFKKTYSSEDQLFIATSYYNISLVLKAQRKFVEAMNYNLKALAIFEKLYGKGHLFVAMSYNNMDSMLHMAGKVLKEQEEGEKTVRDHLKASVVDEKMNDKEHLGIAASYNNVGLVLKDQGKYEEAIKYFLKALAVDEKVNGKDHLSVAASYNNISEALKVQGKYAEAMEYYLQALAIYEKVYGKDHLDVATFCNSIGMMLHAQGKYTEAMEYYLQALGIRKKVYGEDHADTADSCNNIGVVLHSHGKYAEAMEYHLKALGIRKKVYGTEHSDVANSYNGIGLVLKGQGKYEEAMEHFLQALAIFEKTYCEDRLSFAMSYYNISLVLKAQRKFAEAIEYGLKALAIYEEVYGKDHPLFAMSYRNIDEVLETQYQETVVRENLSKKAHEAYQVGDLSTAISCYEALNEKHNLACMYHCKALQEKNRGQEKEHLEYLDKARTTFKAIFDSLSKETIKTSAYVEYAMFLLKYHNRNNQEEYESIQGLLAQGIGQDDNSGLIYDKLERSTTVKPLQDLIDKQGEVRIKPKALAYYLLLSLYYTHCEEDNMDETFEQFIAYASSLENQDKSIIVQYLLADAMELLKNKDIKSLEQQGIMPSKGANINTLQKNSIRGKERWEISLVHPHISLFMNIAATNAAQDLLKMAGIDSNEVKVAVDTIKMGEICLSLSFSNSNAFKRFDKYYRENYSNFFLPHSQLKYNAGQTVEIFIDTKVLQEIMPELDRILQEKE